MKFLVKIFSSGFLLLMVLQLTVKEATAQDGTIRGFVYDQTNGEPVIYTNVYLYQTSHGGATDENGYFAISHIPPGDYTLMVTFIGYDTLRMPVTIRPNDVITKQLYLKEASYVLKGIDITAERSESKTETMVSVIKITPKQISQIPSIGGIPDLAQYLQVLPGVIFTGDQGGQLYIRGGSPVQNKVLLDGMTIYNPFHSIGLFSVFETDIIRNTEVFTGGFGAEYGDRISSVIDITTRDGNKKRFAGKVGASTFGAELLIEGPIKKQREGGSGSSSFILSGRHSYLDKSSEIFYQYIDSAGLPFTFTDLYGKISLNAANGSKVNFFGFRYDDRVNDYQSIADYHWDSYGVGTNFLVIPGKSPALMEGYIAYTDYKITLDEGTSPTRSSQINGFNLGLDFTYLLGKDMIKYGVEMMGFKTLFDFYNSLNRKIEQKENTTELGIYIQYKMIAGKFLIEPSFRVQWYASLGDLSPEPRLALKYNATDDFRIKLAGGLYSQNLISARSDRDVVNLFYGFLSGPDNLPEEFDGKDVNHKLQKAQHAILGFEYNLGRHIIFNLEGYYKNFSQLTNLNRNKIYDDSEDNADKPDELKKDFIIEKGYATGMDFSVKTEYERFYFWGVYSLGYIKLDDGIIGYYPHYDRRHNVNLVLTYTLGPARTWEFSSRWNLGTGFPFTETQGFYEKITFYDGINTDYTTVNGNLGIQYGEVNQGRLPVFHRLDINFKKIFFIGNHAKLEINLGATNVYNRDNVFYIDRVTNERVDQLPIMPSLGLKYSF
ncbi:MAG TPA: TonB-dependent receptor [Bacteroidales bacterium]|nr:TonB-dependent receptor [Bacteroidales bacterium]HNS46138.1 TonB-dependent receptor [Bacteroidales bacterium]